MTRPSDIGRCRSCGARPRIRLDGESCPTGVGWDHAASCERTVAEERRLLHVATLLRDNKLDAEAIVIVRDATMGYPDSFDLWNLWASIPSATPAEVTAAKAQLKRLDPFNPDL